MVKNSLGILSRFHLLVDKHASIEVTEVVMEAEGKEDPWAIETMEKAAVVVAREDFPIEVAGRNKPGPGSVLILT